MPAQQVKTDAICEVCHADFRYDEARRCFSCDALACPHCLISHPQPLCPGCAAGKRLIDPMLAVTADTLPSGSDWCFEFKWDGVRTLAYVDHSNMRLITRNLNDVTWRYPELAELKETIRKEAVFDGEIVALQNGRPSFSRLQQRMHVSPGKVAAARAKTEIYYFIFDLLFLDGQWLIDQPYIRRRKKLESLNIDSNYLRVPPSRQTMGPSMLKVAKDHGLEGVLAKKADSPYEPGKRSRLWKKIKLIHSQEFVVGGWTRQKGRTDQLGSLLLGYYSPDSVQLQYAGSVGTGFNEQDHRILLDKLAHLESGVDPFVTKTGKKNAVYVNPLLVAEIEYREWPAHRLLRQPAYKGLRADKDPHEVVIERA